MIFLVQSFGWDMPDVAVSLAGGIIGAVFAALIMDGAIIILSFLVGSVFGLPPGLLVWRRPYCDSGGE